MCVCVRVIAEPPGVTEQVPAWCHDSKPNWQAESHLAFATRTYSNIHPRAALSVLRVASAVLCYKDEALWRLERPWEDESKKCRPPHPLLVAALCIARPLRTEGHKCICSRFPTSVREVFFGKMTKWLIPWLVVASLKPDSLNNWIHICATYQHCWWAQTVMWHLNILIKNACSEGKQRGAPARED